MPKLIIRVPAVLRPQAALTLLLATATLGGCAGYEPPKPGVYRAPGEASADISCSYETPTASRFSQLRCLRTEDLKTQAETARRTTDAIYTPPPQPKF